MLNSKTRNTQTVRVRDIVYFWRDNVGWTGSVLVFDTDERVAIIKHNELIKSADFHRARHATRDRCVSDDETSQNEEPSIFGGDSSGESPKSLNVAAIPIVKTPRNRRTQAEILADESKAIVDGLPDKRVSNQRLKPHLATMEDNSEVVENDKLSFNENIDSYRK